MMLYSRPIDHLLFERGEFTATNTLVVSHLQTLLLLQIPFAMGAAILMRVVVLLKLGRLLVGISLGSVLTATLLNGVLLRYYGLGGIAIATTVTQALVMAILAGF